VISVLVAFRDDDGPEGHRTRLWGFVREALATHLPEAEVLIGTDDSMPFNKCRALNDAAGRARGEVIYILDADSWVRSLHVRAAAAAIEAEPERWWRPWNMKLKLSQAATEQVLATPGWDGELGKELTRRFENRNAYWAAPPLLLHRSVFEAVGGLDTRFDGWGQEDEAFALSLKALYGQPEQLIGTCIHLWHPRIGRSGHDLWPGQQDTTRNRALVTEYMKARTPEQMRDLIATR